MQKATQAYLTEIVNRDGHADTAALEDLYGEEGVGEADEGVRGPDKKKQRKKP